MPQDATRVRIKGALKNQSCGRRRKLLQSSWRHLPKSTHVLVPCRALRQRHPLLHHRRQLHALLGAHHL